MSAVGRGDWERGLRGAAAGSVAWESIGATVAVPFWNALLDRYISATRHRLGSEGEIAWAGGHTMAFDDAITLALGSG
jgi:hypothetical protein